MSMDCLLSGPLDVEISLTSRCQLRCVYCSAMPFHGNVIPYDRAIEVISQLQMIGVFSLLLSGGEPCVHPRFLDLVAVASNSVPLLSINSNGIKLSSNRFAKQLHNAAPNALVSISLDSVSPSVNNHFRGAGAEKAMKAIENCIDAQQALCISTVLTPENLDSAHLLVERFAPAVSRFKFFPWVPRSRADLVLLGQNYSRQVEFFYESINAIREKYPSIELITPSAKYNTAVDASEKMRIQCACWNTKLYIDSDLNVFPCYYSASEINQLGSARLNNIKEIWGSEQAVAVRNRAMSERLCGVRFGQQDVPARYRETISR
jgi:MoaA/NifB/PqqE/SkfB family radical SAM enzyme